MFSPALQRAASARTRAHRYRSSAWPLERYSAATAQPRRLQRYAQGRMAGTAPVARHHHISLVRHHHSSLMRELHEIEVDRMPFNASSSSTPNHRLWCETGCKACPLSHKLQRSEQSKLPLVAATAREKDFRIQQEPFQGTAGTIAGTIGPTAGAAPGDRSSRLWRGTAKVN